MLSTLLVSISNAIWGLPLPIATLTLGIYLTVKTRAYQLRNLGEALVAPLKPHESSRGISPFAAACTALSATIGTGNIAGVAGAISLGGAGAVFWMWVSSFFGMMIKAAETALAIRYKSNSADGGEGGPMYYIKNGLPKVYAPLGTAFAFFGIAAAFGSGNAVQVNTAVSALSGLFKGLPETAVSTVRIVLGTLTALAVALVLLGGAKRISDASQALVPAMVVLYLFLTLGVITVCHENIIDALVSIVHGAFCPRAVTGGAVGSAFSAISKGLSRGVFSNEAGMGTSAMAHACSDTANPRHQSLFGIFEVFVDTTLVCTLTALAILCSNTPIPYGRDIGAALTVTAFSEVYGFLAAPLLAVPIFFFAFSSILGWGLYGIRCCVFLFGNRARMPFLFCFCTVSIIGAVSSTETLWLISEICNGLMAIPNMTALILLSPEICKILGAKAPRKVSFKNHFKVCIGHKGGGIREGKVEKRGVPL